MAGRNFYRYAFGYNSKATSGIVIYRMTAGEYLGNSSLQFNGATQAGEFSCNFAVSSFANSPRIFAQDSGGMRIWFNTEGRLDFKMADADTASSSFNLSTGKQYSVRAVWTISGGANGTGQLMLYVDGNLEDTVDRPASLANLNQDFYLGGYDVGSNNLNGEIWSASLSINGFNLGNWPLISESFADTSGFNYDLTSTPQGGSAGDWVAANWTA